MQKILLVQNRNFLKAGTYSDEHLSLPTSLVVADGTRGSGEEDLEQQFAVLTIGDTEYRSGVQALSVGCGQVIT